MASTQTTSSTKKPRLLHTLGDDLRIVSEDMLRLGVGKSVSGTFSGLEAFYLTRDERARLKELRGIRRFFRRIGYFLRGLLFKLTPARRIMLAIAIFAIPSGSWEFTLRTTHLSAHFGGVGTLLLFLVLVLELKDKLVARDELEAGRAVQLALMPTEQPVVDGWDVWLYTQPANDVGGDLVDHLPLDDGRHAVALGDVTGKALPAALLAVKLQATIRALAPRFDDLGEFASAMNSILYRDGLPTRFASLVYLLLTPGDGHVRYLNAGHMPPFVIRGSEVTTLPNGSMVIGMMPGVPFVEQDTTLEPGDTLYAYSDGVSEALDESGDFFGDERLEALVLETRGMPVAQAGQFILDRLETFVGTAEQSDDVSLMILRRR